MVLVGAGDDHGGLRSVEPIQRVLVQAGDVSGDRDDLRLEAVRLDEPRVVIDQVEADGFDPLRSTGHRCFGRVLLLDGLALFIGPICEDPVEDRVERASKDS